MQGCFSLDSFKAHELAVLKDVNTTMPTAYSQAAFDTGVAECRLAKKLQD